MSSLWKIAAHWKGAPEIRWFRSDIMRTRVLGKSSSTRRGPHTVYNLTGTTVTEFSIEWCVSTYLILDSSAMAVSCIHCCEGWILGWLFVRWFGFPGTGCWIRAGSGRHGGSKSSKSDGSYKLDKSYKSDESVNYFSPNSSFRPVLVISFCLNIYFFLNQLTAFVSI